jgi:hypothetical protein
VFVLCQVEVFQRAEDIGEGGVVRTAGDNWILGIKLFAMIVSCDFSLGAPLRSFAGFAVSKTNGNFLLPA